MASNNTATHGHQIKQAVAKSIREGLVAVDKDGQPDHKTRLRYLALSAQLGIRWSGVGMILEQAGQYVSKKKDAPATAPSAFPSWASAAGIEELEASKQPAPEAPETDEPPAEAG